MIQKQMSYLVLPHMIKFPWTKNSPITQSFSICDSSVLQIKSSYVLTYCLRPNEATDSSAFVGEINEMKLKKSAVIFLTLSVTAQKKNIIFASYQFCVKYPGWMKGAC